MFLSITFFHTFSALAIHPTGRFCGDKDGQFAACPDPNAKPPKSGTLAVGLAIDVKPISNMCIEVYHSNYIHIWERGFKMLQFDSDRIFLYNFSISGTGTRWQTLYQFDSAFFEWADLLCCAPNFFINPSVEGFRLTVCSWCMQSDEAFEPFPWHLTIPWPGKVWWLRTHPLQSWIRRWMMMC